MNKQYYRKQMSELRRAMSNDQVSEKSSKISRMFLNWIDLDQYLSFLVYLPIKKEIDTRPLINILLRSQKKIYAPKCDDKQKGCMDFYELDNLETLSPGYCGIAEPCPDSSNKYINEQKAVCILPGLAFDLSGMRLGYGQGFFDRYLCSLSGPKPLLIGFACDFQVFDVLPEDEWDVPVDAVITEKRVVMSDKKDSSSHKLS